MSCFSSLCFDLLWVHVSDQTGCPSDTALVPQKSVCSRALPFRLVHLGTGVQVRNRRSFTSAAMKWLLFILRCNVMTLIKATLRMLLEIFGYMQVIGGSPASISAWDIMKTVKKEWNNDSEGLIPSPTQQRKHKMKFMATVACGSI